MVPRRVKCLLKSEIAFGRHSFTDRSKHGSAWKNGNYSAAWIMDAISSSGRKILITTVSDEEAI